MVHIKTVLRSSYCVVAVVPLLLIGILQSKLVNASSENVVIARIQVAGVTTGTSAEEYVSIYNNTNQDINITGWCVTYNLAKISCFSAPGLQTELYISAYSSTLAMNPTLESIIKTTAPTFRADALFSSSSSVLAATNGSVQIITKQGQVVDSVGWGTGAASGLALPGNIPAGKLFKRTAQDSNVLKDTKNNNLDFETSPLDGVYPRGGVYEFTQPDLCPNTPEIDNVIPPGYVQDDSGNCFKDVCVNIPGLQITTPVGYGIEGPHCSLTSIQITEFLPNAAGTDTGKEFIELHNPNAYPVNLAGYSLLLSTGTKKYTFPEPSVINSGEYIVLSDSQLGFSLPNTTAVLKLFAPDSALVFEAVAYSNPKDDMAWVLIEGAWQYTSVLTPGAANELPALLVGGSGSDLIEESEDCPVGKYRNPMTNRCKNIEVNTSVLTSCAADQERNLATNRCRKITTASATLTPCKVDQERNPETNRCKKIETSASNLKPCDPGQERNPTTNRCRKAGSSAFGSGLDVESKTAPLASFKYKLPLIGLLSTVLVGYGAYEYRNDLRNYIRKVRTNYKRGQPPG